MGMKGPRWTGAAARGARYVGFGFLSGWVVGWGNVTAEVGPPTWWWLAAAAWLVWTACSIERRHPGVVSKQGRGAWSADGSTRLDSPRPERPSEAPTSLAPGYNRPYKRCGCRVGDFCSACEVDVT